MSIFVQCSRVDCGASVDVGMETDWTGHTIGFDPFDGLDYGARILVALPEGWTVDRVGAGDEVIHCPEHADG